MLLAGGLQADNAQVAFRLADEWTVMGIDLAGWHPVRLSAEAPNKAVTMPKLRGEARAGVLPVGVGARKGIRVVVDCAPDACSLYVDVNGDGALRAAPAGTSPGVWEVSLTPPGLDRPRWFRLKLGIGGRILLYAVRGCRAGMLPTKQGPRPALLLDVNGDGAYDLEGNDELCVDLNGDGAFEPVTERVALRPAVHIGEEEFNLSVSPAGDTCRVAVRDRAQGELVAAIPLRNGVVKSAIVTLVRDDGLPLALTEIGRPVTLLESSYHVAGADLWVSDALGHAWHFPFEGEGTGGLTIQVKPGTRSKVRLVAPVRSTLSVQGKIGTDETLSVTVNCVSAEGLQLGVATGGETSDDAVSAKASLVAPDGTVVSASDAGFG